MTLYADLPRVEAPAPEPRRRWSRRRIAITAIATVVLLTVIGTGIGWAVYANTYQPLQPGEFGTRGGRNMSVLTDGVTDTRSVLLGAPGTKGELLLSIRNDGSQDVRLLGLDSHLVPYGITARWAPGIQVGTTVGGSPARAHPFPVTLAAHRDVGVWIYLTKPKCDPNSGAAITALPFRWSAMGVHHRYWYVLTDGLQLPVELCPPAKARNYIDNR